MRRLLERCAITADLAEEAAAERVQDYAGRSKSAATIKAYASGWSGRRLGIPSGSSEATGPVRAVQAWLETARITDGPVFRPLDRFRRVQPTRLSYYSHRVAG